ncbi:tetratricopeptide repeat protein [Dokdonella sp.]|uniref:tetratricopeptide repeat protein n=1 Tax=Dokdonella sp. TaxID=2291710 RepID=UPI0026290023|nr:tetratricopeptide repeat protein [Dokdonella sp.]
MLKESIELHRQGRYAEAEQGYRAWIEEHPNDADAIHTLGLLKHQTGQTAEAIELLERAHGIAPDDARIDLGLASLRLQTGEQDLAARGFERALSLNPNLAGAHIGLGQIALARGDHNAADQHFRIALRADEDPHALAGVGAVALHRGDTETALRNLMRAAELEPQSALIQFLLGQAFSRRGTGAFAERAYDNALKLDPNMHAVRAWLAEHLIRDGRAAEAEPQYRILRDLPGYERIAQLGLADVARETGHNDEAIAGYEAALEADPTLSGPTRALAVSLASLGRNDDVVRAYSRYLAHVPDDDEMRTLRADVLMLLGHWPDALLDLRILSDRNPLDHGARSRLAIASEYLGLLDEARTHAASVLLARPDDAEMHLIEIRALLREGKDDEARAALDAFARLPLTEGQQRLRMNYLGRLYDRSGDTVAAVHAFIAAQYDSLSAMPPLDAPNPQLAEALAEAPGAPWTDAPVLLLGTPGSGVERIAELLADQAPTLGVMRDRAFDPSRDDEFNFPRFPHYCGDLDETERESLRQRYLLPLRRSGVEVGRLIVDWLPRWDAHLLALVRRAMPGTRIVIVERDPRDELVNWLAFGFISGFPCTDAVECANWLVRARQHLHHGAELDEPRRLVVNADAVLADPAGAGAELARFLGLDELRPGARIAFGDRVIGGLPGRFPAGHWQHYRESLADAFTLLE